MTAIPKVRNHGRWILVFSLLLVALVYSTGLSGGWLFDDYPNIVDNRGVQPANTSLPSLVRAALSSPASEFKRPLASLSFAANYLVSGLNPYSWKLTNLLIHLLNGALVFGLARGLLQQTRGRLSIASAPAVLSRRNTRAITVEADAMNGVMAALVAAGWMLLPINLTGVLYVVQRMESMANLFVLLGLIGYVAGRRRMLASPVVHGPSRWAGLGSPGFLICLASITLPTLLGLMAKETAVMLPLYALLVEWAMFRWLRPSSYSEDRGLPSQKELVATTPQADTGRALPAVSRRDPPGETAAGSARPTEVGRRRKDWRVIALFLLVLVLPLIIGLGWIVPALLKPGAWATRDFTLGTRLLSEARIVTDYIGWTLLPTPGALSFYHDDFQVSKGLLAPWTTLASIAFLTGLLALLPWLRRRRPLAALGIALFLGCHLLTGTVLPLELIYEHRNYFASFGLLLAVVPLLAERGVRRVSRMAVDMSVASSSAIGDKSIAAEATPTEEAVSAQWLPLALPRHVLLAGLMLHWAALTAITAHAWGDPLRLAEDLASRAPQSPRAQYELGRTFIIYSHYDPASPFTRMAYAPLEASAALPNSSILPEQALIFMNARMHLPIKEAWWDSIITKLKAYPPGVQDESSLASLTQCTRDGQCALPPERMKQAFVTALSHPAPTARLLATYGDYAWNVLGDHALGERLTVRALEAKPDEPAYRITLIRMLAAQGRRDEARTALNELEPLNVGGRLNGSLQELRGLLGSP